MAVMADRPLTLPARAGAWLRRARGWRQRERSRGQSIVEFALIMPLMMILLMAVIEFALAFNAEIGVNRASMNAVLVASATGNTGGSDCLILRSVENDVLAPNDTAKINEVEIQWVSNTGNTVKASSLYTRGGSMTCTYAGASITVPYTATTSGYPVAQRCNIVAGCTGLSATHTTVDTIAVRVRYTYTYQTPMGELLKMIAPTATSSTWTFNKRNVSRLEPVL
jgi:Flp pilus assembly protein TadG